MRSERVMRPATENREEDGTDYDAPLHGVSLSKTASESSSDFQIIVLENLAPTAANKRIILHNGSPLAVLQLEGEATI
jgi:hypothetical protein